jgi:energy-coupling factor transporter ATP-binding protein EcfA2
LRIGFPVLAGNNEIVKVFLELIQDNQRAIKCTGLPIGDQILKSIDAAPIALHEYIAEILRSGDSITFRMEGGSNAARTSLFRSDIGLWDADGPSGTLAMLVLCYLGGAIRAAASKVDILLSARINRDDSNISVIALNSKRNTQIKVQGTTEDLWLHRKDYDALDPVLATQSRVIPLDAPGNRLDWFLHEFCDRYTLAIPKDLESTYGRRAGAVDNKVPRRPVSERRLFEAAISTTLFGANNATQDAASHLQQAIGRHFTARTERHLLPIQLKAIARRHLPRLFFDPLGEQEELRHAVISGPTGCGKTTLIQSLVLNGLHHRNGGVLYVGPVKALVEEFYTSIHTDLAHLLPAESEMRILLSTGDFSRDDSLITQGRFGLACIVNEKANVLFSSDGPTDLIKGLSLVIVDELHMLRDASRGGVLDLLLTKVAREAHARRMARTPNPLQIVMVSTEGMAKSIEVMPRYFTDPEDSTTKPVLLTASRRPIAVRHQVAVLSETTREFSLRDVVQFSSNADRRLTKDVIVGLVTRLGPGPDRWDQWVSTSGARAYFDGQVQALILKKREEHKSIIVALSSVESTYATAAALCKKLNHILDATPVDSNFISEVNRSGMGRLQEKLVFWATKGIYVHHSQLPRRLRAAIEKVFRSATKPNTRPKILLTTETLTYGVNLSASCVILSTLEWRRDDPVVQFLPPSPEELDPNQFHNLLGRAGRLGFMGSEEIAEAIVCIPVSEFLAPKNRMRFIARYYSEQAAVVPYSAIFQPQDLDRFVYSREAQVAIPKPSSVLADYSFSALRTTIDTVRTAGTRGAPMTAILDVLQSTLAYQAAAATHDHRTQAKLESCLTDVLEKASGYLKGNIKLVTFVGNLYEVTGAASALIDTGTSLNSVEPMAIWLQMLSARDDFKFLNSEALLPGLIAAPDFTKVACELIPGAMSKDKFDNPDDALRRLEQIKVLAKTELSMIGCDSLALSIEQYLLKSEISSTLRIVAVAERRPIVFWQLLATVLRWLRGCAEDEVAAPLVLFKGVSKRWLPKHSDRLEQLAKMCYRFFSLGDDGFLSKQQKLQLPKLALRLKHGIPFSATPYLNVFSMDGILPRDAVVALHCAVPDPFVLLQARGTEIARIQLVVEEVHTNAKDAMEVCAVVRRAYMEYFISFLNSIDRENAAGFIQMIRDHLHPQDLEFNKNWRPAGMVEVFQAHLELPASINELPLAATGSMSQKVLALTDSDGNHRSFFSTKDRVEVGAPAVLHLLAWHEPPPANRWSITPCAFILVASLISRRLLDGDDIVRAVSGAPERIDVYWVASALWDATSLESMTALREDMLGFVEPMQNLQSAVSNT